LVFFFWFWGYFGHFLGLRGILVIFRFWGYFGIFFKVLGAFWSFKGFQSIFVIL